MIMQTGLVHLHNLLRWVILILLLLSIYKSYTGWKGNKVFSASDKKTWLFTMIASHITLLLGLYQWTFGRLGIFAIGLNMKDPVQRFFQMEHPVTMILAVILVTRGYLFSKKDLADDIKYKKALNAFALALLLILVAVPWPYKAAVARPLFPGM
jgi:hypothetical protein